MFICAWYSNLILLQRRHVSNIVQVQVFFCECLLTVYADNKSTNIKQPNMATDDKVQLLMAAVTPKIPTFYAKNPALWFATTEAEFEICNPKVTSDTTKFSYLVRALDEDTAQRCSDLIVNPPKEDRYGALKQRLLQSFQLTRRERATRILDYPTRGDKTATQMADELKMWVEQNTEDFLVREIFLRRLPKHIRAILDEDEQSGLHALAERADKVMSKEPVPIVAAEPQALPLDIDAATGMKTRSQGSSKTKVCYFHRKFGEKAKNRELPCKFEIKGNGKAGRQ